MKDPVCGKTVELRDAVGMAIDEGRPYYFCSSVCQDQFKQSPESYRQQPLPTPLTLGVMGSAGNDHSSEIDDKARELGRWCARLGLTLITGACPGLPLACARGAREAGGQSVGISPALSLDEHLYKYHSPNDAFDVLIYTGSGLMGREVTNIRSSDMVIILGGRSGTLGEFSIAYDEGKLIGVLQHSGGITDQIPTLIESFGKATGALLIYDAEPGQLLRRMLAVYEERHFRHPSCFCNETQPADG